jgi:hypothetical protein
MDMAGEQFSQDVLHLHRGHSPLQLQGTKANLGVLAKDSRDGRILGPTRAGEAWQQHLLLDSEVELPVSVPELKEGSSRRDRVLVVHMLQAAGDYQRVMVIAREALKIGVAFHFC